MIIRNKLKTIISVGAALFLYGLVNAGLTQAATYWASPQGSQYASCTEISRSSDPGRYGTFARAVACAKGGDTVLVKPGVYTSDTAIKNPQSITVQGTDPGNWPVLKPPSGSNINLVNFSGSTIRDRTISFRYIKWDMENLTGYSRCLRTSSDVSNIFITVEDFECAGPAVDAEISGILFSAGSRVIMRRGKIHRFQSVLSRGAHCIYMGASNTLIEYVECSNVNGYGIQFYNSDKSMITNNIFRYNTFHNLTNRGPVYFQSSSQNNQIYGNIFTDWANTAIVLKGSGNKVWNNTFYDTRFNRTGVQVSCSSECELKNNIIRVPNGTPVSGSSGTAQSNNLTTDPMFVDPAKRNLRLTSGSSAIDKGLTIPEVSLDIDGIMRPQNLSYDIGAYEYNAGEVTVIKPNAPSNLQAAPK